MAEKAQAAKPADRRRGASPGSAAVRDPLPLRGRIPALAPAQVQALRALFRAPHSWVLSDHGLLHLMPGHPHPPDQTFELDAEGTRVGLRLQATAAVLGDGLHWSDFTGRSRILAWSLAHEAQLMR